MVKQNLHAAARIAAVVFAILLSLPMVYAQTGGNVTGTVQSVNRNLNYITVTDSTGRPLRIDVRNMNSGQSINVWQLHPGDQISVNGGWRSNGSFQAVNVNYSGSPMFNSSNTLYGTVDGRNRNLNYITVRDSNGHRVKVDVRGMDTRRSANVWNLRNGDSIEVTGGWTNGDTFRASRVGISTYPPMSSAYGGPNLIHGTVQNINRGLNYVTVRDDATGAVVKIDVRRMDTGRSVNVWRLRPGDHVSVNGGWEDRETFNATTVNF